MGKKLWAAILMLLMAVPLAGCDWGGTGDREKLTAAQIVSDKNLSPDEKATRLVQAMTLAEKVGQMVMIGINGTAVDEDSLFMLHQYHVGGVILFGRNLESAAQVKKLTGDLQASAEEKLPLLIAIDEEGGRVVRMPGIVPPPPAQRELGDSGDTAAIETWARRTAAELKALGINLNFAPVADVAASGALSSTGDRSYGESADLVATCVQAAAKGYEQENMIYALKHFPGIGRGTVDSHQDISTIAATRDELLAVDVVPFKAIIDEKPPENYFVLVSHLAYSDLDAGTPATLSPAIMTCLLRQGLGYKGVAITDDLEMGALKNYGTFRELAVRAVQAGADIVMVCHEYGHQADAYLGILEAAEKGEISEARINEAATRIVKTKLAHL